MRRARCCLGQPPAKILGFFVQDKHIEYKCCVALATQLEYSALMDTLAAAICQTLMASQLLFK